MKLREFLQQAGANESYTFIISKAVKDEHSPSHHPEYHNTPIRSVWEWLTSTLPDRYLVIKKDHPPIDVSNGWSNWYNKGHLHCCVITTEEDIRTLYPNEEQAREMLEWYDEKVKSKK